MPAATQTADSTSTADVAAATTAPAKRPTSNITSSKRVSFNFQDAPVDSILNYLSEVLDFIVVKDNSISGHVTITSKQPVTGEEAVDALEHGPQTA